MDNKNLGKILIAMGAATLITTIVDYFALIFPTNIKNPQWVFGVTQAISDISVMPAIAIVFLVIGFMFIKDKFNEGPTNIALKATAVLSLLFGIAFAVSAFMYAISAGGVENLAVDNLKKTNSNAKEQLNKFYEANKSNIDETKYNKYVEKMDEQMMISINQASSGIQKATFKTMLNLGFFSLFNIYLFINVFGLIDFIKYKVLKVKKAA